MYLLSGFRSTCSAPRSAPHCSKGRWQCDLRVYRWVCLSLAPLFCKQVTGLIILPCLHYLRCSNQRVSSCFSTAYGYEYRIHLRTPLCSELAVEAACSELHGNPIRDYSPLRLPVTVAELRLHGLTKLNSQCESCIGCLPVEMESADLSR
jgi:hypothetical protein